MIKKTANFDFQLNRCGDPHFETRPKTMTKNGGRVRCGPDGLAMFSQLFANHHSHLALPSLSVHFTNKIHQVGLDSTDWLEAQANK